MNVPKNLKGEKIMNNSTQQKSYVRYTGLFNKVCSSVLFLVLACLVSVYCLMAVVDFFRSFSGGPIAIVLAALPALFAVLSTIGVWMMYLGAKKNNIGAGNIGLSSSIVKWQQVIKTIFVVVAIIAVIAIVALLFLIQSELGGAVEDAGQLTAEISGTLNEFGLPAEAMSAVKSVLDTLAFILSAGPIVVAIAGIVLIAILIIEISRYSALVKFLNGATKMYKTGHMVAPPSMFFVIVTFIFAGFSILTTIMGASMFGSLKIADLIYPAMMVIVGIIMLQNKDELASIYAAWQSEIGMVNPGVAQQVPVATPAAPAAPAEAPAEAPVEAPATEENNNTDAE